MQSISILLVVVGIFFFSTHNCFAQFDDDWNGKPKREIFYDTLNHLILKKERTLSGINHNLGEISPRSSKIKFTVINQKTGEVYLQKIWKGKQKGCVSSTRKYNEIQLTKNDFQYFKRNLLRKYITKQYDQHGKCISRKVNEP